MVRKHLCTNKDTVKAGETNLVVIGLHLEMWLTLNDITQGEKLWEGHQT